MKPKTPKHELLELLNKKDVGKIEPRNDITEYRDEQTIKYLLIPLLNSLVTSLLACALTTFKAFPIIFVIRLFWVVLYKTKK